MESSKSVAQAVKDSSCPLCHAKAETRRENPDRWVVECKNCGRYTIEDLLTIVLSQGDVNYPQHILSGVTRNASEHGQLIHLDVNNAQRLVDEAPVPRTLFDAMDRMLAYLAKSAPNFLSSFSPEFDHLAPIAFLKDRDEAIQLLMKMKNAGLIEWESTNRIGLTLNGWQRVEELKATGAKSDQGFVAMWFDPSTDDAWEHGFRVALKENGYEPVRVDLIHHNQKICDRIITEIRRSGLVVADFTGNRAGVYYEAGFAQGLGIPVIWTCREDHFEEVHFDTRQYNHIVWRDATDLNSQLSDRIAATVSASLLLD